MAGVLISPHFVICPQMLRASSSEQRCECWPEDPASVFLLHLLLLLVIPGLSPQVFSCHLTARCPWQRQTCIVFRAYEVRGEERASFPSDYSKSPREPSTWPAWVISLSQGDGVLWSEFDCVASLQEGGVHRPTEITRTEKDFWGIGVDYFPEGLLGWQNTPTWHYVCHLLAMGTLVIDLFQVDGDMVSLFLTHKKTFPYPIPPHPTPPSRALLCLIDQDWVTAPFLNQQLPGDLGQDCDGLRTNTSGRELRAGSQPWRPLYPPPWRENM